MRVTVGSVGFGEARVEELRHGSIPNIINSNKTDHK